MIFKNSLIFIWTIGFVLLNFASLSSASVPEGDLKVFGVSLRWEANNSETNQALDEKIHLKAAQLTESWDPDCIWRKKEKNICKPPAHPEQTREIEKIANLMREETDGYFEIKRPVTKERDFSGLSEGEFLQEIKETQIGSWIADFAGDIYFSAGFTPQKPFTISDPIFDKITFAKVKMKSGWMIQATGRMLGQRMWNPRAGHSVWHEDFQEIVLFAQKNFNGGRLDAWSTALIPGGRSLLSHLWEQPRFKGQWAYLYFDRKGRPVCSQNLKCDFHDSANRLVSSPF